MGNVAVATEFDGSRPFDPCVESSQNGNVLPLAALQSEGTWLTVTMEDRHRRHELVEQLRALPREALQNMRHFQTQVGCLNRCSFCSQSAGTTLWNMSRRDLANLVAAIKVVALEWAREAGEVCVEPLNAAGVFAPTFAMPTHGLIGNKRNDRPGVIYCYLDNDPAAYPHLDDLVQWLHEDLGVQVRIATVGYSRLNPKIQAMHERISNTLMSGIAGLRLSFSPYTYGWTQGAERVGAATRDDFERDVAVMLNTYRSTFLSQRKGRKGASVELRFRPLVVPYEVEVRELQGHRVLRAGPYLVVQKAAHQTLEVATITDAKSHGTELSQPGEPCWLIYGHEQIVQEEMGALISTLSLGASLPPTLQCRDAILHRLQNEDGEYFAVDAERRPNGVTAKYFYPKTERRPGAGYIDGERYLLNLLIQAKSTCQNKTWTDVERIVATLYELAGNLDDHDPRAAAYIREQVVEVLKSYMRVLHLADYPATAFFDKHLSVDTGHICNLGRAYHEYKAIASRPDLPLTPNHERAFGLTGELAEEGQAWRLAVAPVLGASSTTSARGERNTYRNSPSILVERLDLAMTATPEGQSRERFFLKTESIERITIRDALRFPVIPGHHAKGE
ncbi:hypothetical protein SQW19_16510 [Stenotrophomonas acidaminiphila]|uniref:hypothetical protein n=1 Tax=Stenotrophomonas acidaminiphila TaxID=128780 RepID=UPI002ABE8280|nr:hypothetical protein [Stenotrophomonas acidaminiphila]WPU55907.1 hypothetical protein SQW19_16510 [Stenotrophomonas acidaminiphila]